MNDSTGEPAVGAGLVRLFARHPTAGNLLMAVMVLLGLLALAKLNRQFLPDLAST